MRNIQAKKYGYLCVVLLLLSTLLICVDWTHSKQENTHKGRLWTTDTLRVGMCASAISWNQVAQQGEGYDYELLQNIAEKYGWKIAIVDTPKDKLLQALKNGKIDLAAYPCPTSHKKNMELLFIPMQKRDRMVIVQQDGSDMLHSTAELNHRTVTVRRNSMAHRQLTRINKEIGGGMRLRLVHDSVSVDSLIRAVVNGKWDYAVAPEMEARAYKRIYPQLSIGLAVSAEKTTGWAMKDSTLLQAISEWKEENPETIHLLHKRYVEQATMLTQRAFRGHGEISPYDDYFKKHAPHIHWDWHLLAALCYHESRFNPLTISPAGACGLMQLMPITARRFGLNDTTMFDPSENIRAGVEYIKYLNMFYDEIEDTDERIKFILASYNAGPAHVLDAMRLAKKNGKNPHVWYDHVEYFLLKKNEAEYYEDPDVRFGKFNGRPTCAYVKNVINTYHTWCSGK